MTGESHTVPDDRRDDVDALDGTPSVVSVSDVHGYLDEARSALLTLADHPAHDAVVHEGEDGRLHWADNDHVLVFDGDLVDRGPANARTVALARRLQREAPPGRVRIHLGNHEMALLFPGIVSWPRWYSGQVDDAERRRWYDDVRTGRVAAAYRGYDHTFVHAGRPESVDARVLNDRLVDAVDRVDEVLGTPEAETVQEDLRDSHAALLGLGGRTGRGPGAGAFWLDFEHMPPDAPPQVVGHTRHDRPTRDGNVVCANVIRNTRGSPGGEAVVVETPDALTALVREPDGGVDERDLSLSYRR